MIFSIFVCFILIGNSFSSDTCQDFPEETEGPYYYGTGLVRRNVSEDKAGIPFTLIITIMNFTSCQPIENAAVEIWHCDAGGIYSHFIAASMSGSASDTDNSTFLRGIQITDSSGVASFDSIFPGWYVSRDTHIHYKIHLGGSVSNGVYTYGTTIHTGQFFFNDTLLDTVATYSPYSDHNVVRTLLTQDNVYTTQDLGTGLLTITGDANSGFIGYKTVGVEGTAGESTASSAHIVNASWKMISVIFLFIFCFVL